MPFQELHRKVARIALRAAAQHGFALAGGNALMAYGVVDRFTEDVDLFTDDEAGVQAAAAKIEKALYSEGYTTCREDKTAGRMDRDLARRQPDDDAAAGLLRPHPGAGQP